PSSPKPSGRAREAAEPCPPQKKETHADTSPQQERERRGKRARGRDRRPADRLGRGAAAHLRAETLPAAQALLWRLRLGARPLPRPAPGARARPLRVRAQTARLGQAARMRDRAECTLAADHKSRPRTRTRIYVCRASRLGAAPPRLCKR